ncbi:hypothetical protein ACSSS7_002700 [Eimeria intestinalis]
MIAASASASASASAATATAAGAATAAAFLQDIPPSPPSFSTCVELGVYLFDDLFNSQIRQLLSAFPLDHRTESGALFWASPKRPPKAIEFNPNDPLHMQFVFAAANLFANAYGVPEMRDMQRVQQLAAAVKPPPFVEKQLQIKIDEGEESNGSNSSSSSSSRLQADVQHSEEEERQKLQDFLENLKNLSQRTTRHCLLPDAAADAAAAAAAVSRPSAYAAAADGFT